MFGPHGSRKSIDQIIVLCITSIRLCYSQEPNLFQTLFTSLQTPPSSNATDGLLSTDCILARANFTLPNTNITITTRLFNGQYPGPTLRLSAGDKLQLNFTNSLKDQKALFVHNVLSGPDETNLHFHGLHVSGELPSDDPTYVVEPSESYEYMTDLPEDHMGGTHWMHPHRHGSSAVSLNDS